MFSHQVIAVVHVLSTSQSGDYLPHLCVKLNVFMLLLTDDDGTLRRGKHTIEHVMWTVIPLTGGWGVQLDTYLPS